MSWPYSNAAKHFRMAKERGIGWKRTICGTMVKTKFTYELREGQVVDCPACMLVKDAWLETTKRKPLTVLRCRQLWRDRFGYGSESDLSPLEQYNAKPKPPPTTEQLQQQMADSLARQLRRAAAVVKEQEDARLAKLKTSTDRVLRRRASVFRLQTKLKLTESFLKRAERRLKQAERADEKLRTQDQTHHTQH